MQGAGPQTATLKAEKLEPGPARGADFRARATKSGRRVRVELTNRSDRPLLVGDAVLVAGRNA